jgi:hypothetical protein
MGTLHDASCTFAIISRSVLVRMGHVSGKSYRGNQNTHFMFNTSFYLFENGAVYENAEKYFRAGQDTYDSMAHAHCMFDTSGYKYTLLLLLHFNNGCTNAPQCYVIRTLSVVLVSCSLFVNKS